MDKRNVLPFIRSNWFNVESKDVRKNPNQVFPNKYLYEIVFDSEHKLVLPLRFKINQNEKEEYNIDFGL